MRLPPTLSVRELAAAPCSTPATLTLPATLSVARPLAVSTPPAATVSELTAVVLAAPGVPMEQAPLTSTSWAAVLEQAEHTAQAWGKALPAGHTCVPRLHAMGALPAGQ